MSNKATSSQTLLSFAALALLALPGQLPAQQPREPGGRMLLVKHPAASPAAAEVGRIEFGVETVAATATGARAANELAVQRVVRALTQAGVPAAGLTPTGTTLLAEYERFEVVAPTTIRGERQVVAYRAVSGISAAVPDPNRVGFLVDVAHAAGATQLEGAYIPVGGPSPVAPAVRQPAIPAGVRRVSAQVISDS